MHKIFNLVIKYSIYGLVLLMPLFFLSWTNEVYEFNKQYLLVGLVALALMAWLAKMILVKKKVVFRRTPLDIWILVFMAAMILAAVFSVDKSSSWFGFYGRFSDSVVGLIALCLMYFVVVNNISKTKKIIRLFLWASGIVIVTAYLSVFNFWSKIPGLPEVMKLRTFNPVAGSFEALSIFLVVVIGLIAGLLLNRQSQISKIAYSLLLLAAVILLVLIDFQPAWLSLGLVMLVLLVMAIWKGLFRERVNLLLLPIILLIISGVCGIADFEQKITQDLFANPLPQEVILDYQTAYSVTWQGLKEQPVLGSGPGTFLADFTKFKPVEFNEARFWNIRFDKGPSHLMEMVGTSGILGILSYLLLIGVFLLVMFLGWQKSNSYPISDNRHPAPILLLPLILAWLSLLVAQFVYLQNTVLSFYFWLLMALIVIIWQRSQDKPVKKISFSFEKLPEVGLMFNVLLLILVFALTALFYLGGRFYLADLKFSQSVLAVNNQELVEKLEKTVNLNKYRENYRRALSQAYLNGAWQELRKPAEEQRIQLLQAYASGSIQQARTATQLSSRLVMTWENLGMIYRDARGLVGGTLPFALESFAKALELEPNNPLFYRELCRLNLISQEKDWDETLNYCQRAIDLKENYLDAHVQLALVYEQKGDLEAALGQMEAVLDKLKGVSFQRGSALAGAATEIYFQLGRLHFNLNHIDEAIKMFEQSVIIMPNYANARYGLSVSYQVNGRLQDALIQLAIVDQLAPGNQEIIAAIQALQAQLQPTQ